MNKEEALEIVKSSVFKKNLPKMKKKKYLEHVTKFFYENHRKFKIINLKNKINLKN